LADLLNFNPSRKLEFDLDRPLEFDPQHPLEFNPARGLDFQPNRDLGFGRRGVVFRGYVCPICGSLVTVDSKRCSECGAVFESTPRAASPPSKAPGTPPPGSAKFPKVTPPPAPARAPASMVYCAYCGVRLGKSDEFCWSCGAKTGGATEAVKLPAKKTTPVTREWQRGR
jgi:hypothetical protein